MESDPNKNRLQRLYSRLIKIRGAPRDIALGFALGIFIGSSPFFGFHMVIAIFLAVWLSWNKLAALIGVQITNIFTAPFFYGFTYLIGAKLIGLKNSFRLPEEFSMATIIDLIKTGNQILWALIVGGVIVGIPLSIIAYYVAFNIFTQYQNKIKPKIKPKLDQVRKKNRKKKKKKR